MKQLRTIAGAATLAALVAAPTQAEQFWADNSVSVLHSADYYDVAHALGFTQEKTFEATVMTVEHASGHDWGDAFFFVDRINGKGSSSDFSETYGELSPRFSLSNMTGAELKAGPVTDVLLATTYEFGETIAGNTSQDNYLYGVGLNWDLPGFAFFQTNFFYANNDNVDDDLQLTVVYGVPFSTGDVDWMFDGYIDWSSAQDDHKADFHFNPQLRADVGKFIGITKSKLEAGIEYSYWHNKFGIQSDDAESAVSALIKYHL